MEIIEWLLTLMGRSVVSTAASYKAHRPREEIIVIEDNIIWFKQ